MYKCVTSQMIDVVCQKIGGENFDFFFFFYLNLKRNQKESQKI